MTDASGGVESVGWQFHSAGDPALAPSADPARSRYRLTEARLDSAPNRGEVRRRDEVLALLEEHGAALASRRTAPGHLTASALVVDAERDRVALLLHRKLGRWLQPGGHADGDHELAGVALKEASEETGIEGLRVLTPAVDLDVHAVDHGDELGEHLHLDLRFVVVAPAGAELEGNHESLAIRWVDRSELADHVDEDGILRLADAGAAALAQIQLAQIQTHR